MFHNHNPLRREKATPPPSPKTPPAAIDSKPAPAHNQINRKRPARKAEAMETPFLILAFVMMSTGFVMFLVGIGLLVYGIWLRYRVETPTREPNPDIATAIAPSAPTEAQQP